MSPLISAFVGSLASLALCIIAGFVLRRRNILTDAHADAMGEVLMKLSMPATIFIALIRDFSPALLLESVATFFITGTIFLAGGYLTLLATRILRTNPATAACWRFGVAFPNVAFMGIPLILAIYGPDGLIYVSMAVAAFSILAFTAGTRMFAATAPPKARPAVQMLTTAWLRASMADLLRFMASNPVIPATIIGVVFFVMRLRLPAPIADGIALIGAMTSPLSMIFVGIVLARNSILRAFADVRVLLPIGIRLLIVPVATYFVLVRFVQNPLMLNTIVILMAMPSAAVTVIFAQQNKSDPESGAGMVVVSTLLSVATVAIILGLL